MSKYTLELVNYAGVLLADLSGRAKNRRLIASRNEAEEINWRLDLDEFEKYCRDTRQDPRVILKERSTEVRVKRGNKYLMGGVIVWKNTHIDGVTRYIDIRAVGFLNLFKERYTAVEQNYTSIDGSLIAQGLIVTTQAQTNGDFGVVPTILATSGIHTRQYQLKNIKDALQELTRLQTGAFDMEFTYDKKFNTYIRMGSDRPDVVFEWGKNIKSIDVPEDFTNPANQVIALGSGIGALAGVSVTVNDPDSQADYKLQQKIVQSNGTDNSDNGVTDAANSELARGTRPFEVPTLTVDGNTGVAITDFGIGDRVLVKVDGYKSLEHVDALYRVERYELTIDENDNEEYVLYVSR